LFCASIFRTYKSLEISEVILEYSMNTQSLANIPLHCLSLADEAACRGSVNRVIGLDRSRAAAWLVYTEGLLAASKSCDAIEHFFENLQDACWLARWKRENVVLDIEVSLLPTLIAQLVSAATDKATTSVLEDMLVTLAGEGLGHR
jgi:hypothetical protein